MCEAAAGSALGTGFVGLGTHRGTRQQSSAEVHQSGNYRVVGQQSIVRNIKKRGISNAKPSISTALSLATPGLQGEGIQALRQL